MSHQIKISSRFHFALFEFFGDLSTSEATEAFLEFVRSPDFGPTYAMLSDARGVQKIHSSFREVLFGVMSLSEALEKFDREAVSVILVSSDQVFGMARMLEGVLDQYSNIEVHVTTNEKEALGLVNRSEQSIDELKQSLCDQTFHISAQ